MKLRLGAIICLSVVSVAAAQTPYHTTPDWTSADHEVSTGGALVDLDLDGWLDLVVSNGNDMAQQHVAVYYNQGDGTFPSWPDWESDDFAYNGHLDVADVNGDGLNDRDEVEQHGTDPTNPDTDGDGADDGWEVRHEADPLDPDSIPPVPAAAAAALAATLGALAWAGARETTRKP